MEAKFSAWNLFKLAYYGKFDFSRLDLDGNKLAKCICLARKMRDRGEFTSGTEGCQFFCFEFKSALKGLISSQ